MTKRWPLTRSATVGAAWLALLVLLAVTADLLPLHPPGVRAGEPRVTPFTDWSTILGTDRLGRDQLSRLIYGARVSLAVSLGAAAAATLLGGTLGILAGFFRGWVDDVVGIVTDALLSLPPIVMIVALAAILKPSFETIVIALAVIAFPYFIRVSRANTLRFREELFVVASRSIGATPARIVWRHIVPNVVPPILAYGTVMVAVMIVAEASVSYLGLGTRPPTPSWGVMIADGQQDLSTYPMLVLVPAAFLFAAVFALNAVSEFARSTFDTGAAKL